MKKLVILLFIVCSVASCAKEELFSCDPEANLWAKNNRTEIQQMSRESFIAIGDLVKQRAAYNAFTPNQRQALWIGKLEEVLKLDWSEQERQHIRSLLELIMVNSFIFSSERDPEAFDKIEVEIYKWTEYTQKKLGWDKKLLYALIGTPKVMNAKKEIVEINSGMSPTLRLKSGNESGGKPTCNCSMDFDLCSIGPGTAKCREKWKGEYCDWSAWGCGPLGLNNCSGVCVVY